MGRDHICKEVASRERWEVEGKGVAVGESLGIKVLTSWWENPVREHSSGESIGSTFRRALRAWRTVREPLVCSKPPLPDT